MAKPWGSIDPNSTHQVWSRWTFTVADLGAHPDYKSVKSNFARWARKGFGSVARAKVEEKIDTWVMLVEAEGVPVQDPTYRTAVQLGFDRFVEQGWGHLGIGKVDAELLAGENDSGKPRTQLVVMPIIAQAPKAPIRAASIEVCANQCGSKCCRGPGFIRLRKDEAERLSKLSPFFLADPDDQGRPTVFLEAGEACVFLGAKGECTIYEQRPEACRKFPSSPWPGCLVWPASLEV